MTDPRQATATPVIQVSTANTGLPTPPTDANDSQAKRPPPVPDELLKGGRLDPDRLIEFVDGQAGETGLSSRTRYNLACWYAGKAGRMGKTPARRERRRSVELEALRELEQGLASGRPIVRWARSDPSLKPLRESPNLKTRSEFNALVDSAAQEGAAGDLSTMTEIGAGWIARLKAAKIDTQEVLIKRTGDTKSISELAIVLDAPTDLIMRWRNAVRLAAITKSATASNLLVTAGVTTVGALARSNPRQLTRRLSYVNQPPTLLRTPEEDEVAAWIAAAAKTTP